MKNYELLKQDLLCITQSTFEQAFFLAYRDGITSIASLGFSGDDIILYEGGQNEKVSRVSRVSVRNYGNDVELLITDRVGNFLFYGRYAIDLGVEFVARTYWHTFETLRPYIDTELPKSRSFTFADVNPNATYSEGFAILKAYQEVLTGSGITDKPA